MPGFRPTLLPTLVTLPALLVLLGLGTWQLQRLAWKEAQIAERQAQLAAEPVPLPAFADPRAAGLAHRRFTASGVYLHEKTLFHGFRTVGGVPGVELLTPLRMEDGRVVMVNRGWVPSAARQAAERPQTLTAGPVQLSGVLRPAREEAGWFTPEPDPEAGHWFSYDVAAMARHLQLPLLPAVLEAQPGSEPGRLPLGREAEVDLVNHHLQYAITWFTLAVALAVIYVIYHWRRED